MVRLPAKLRKLVSNRRWFGFLWKRRLPILIIAIAIIIYRQHESQKQAERLADLKSINAKMRLAAQCYESGRYDRGEALLQEVPVENRNFAWGLLNNKLSGYFLKWKPDAGEILKMCFSKDSRFLIAFVKKNDERFSRESIKVFDIQKQQETKTIPINIKKRFIDFTASPDGQSFYCMTSIFGGGQMEIYEYSLLKSGEMKLIKSWNERAYSPEICGFIRSGHSDQLVIYKIIPHIDGSIHRVKTKIVSTNLRTMISNEVELDGECRRFSTTENPLQINYIAEDQADHILLKSINLFSKEVATILDINTDIRFFNDEKISENGSLLISRDRRSINIHRQGQLVSKVTDSDLLKREYYISPHSKFIAFASNNNIQIRMSNGNRMIYQIPIGMIDRNLPWADPIFDNQERYFAFVDRTSTAPEIKLFLIDYSDYVGDQKNSELITQDGMHPIIHGEKINDYESDYPITQNINRRINFAGVSWVSPDGKYTFNYTPGDSTIAIVQQSNNNIIASLKNDKKVNSFLGFSLDSKSLRFSDTNGLYRWDFNKSNSAVLIDQFMKRDNLDKVQESKLFQLIRFFLLRNLGVDISNNSSYPVIVEETKYFSIDDQSGFFARRDETIEKTLDKVINDNGKIEYFTNHKRIKLELCIGETRNRENKRKHVIDCMSLADMNLTNSDTTRKYPEIMVFPDKNIALIHSTDGSQGKIRLTFIDLVSNETIFTISESFEEKFYRQIENKKMKPELSSDGNCLLIPIKYKAGDLYSAIMQQAMFDDSDRRTRYLSQMAIYYAQKIDTVGLINNDQSLSPEEREKVMQLTLEYQYHFSVTAEIQEAFYTKARR